MIVIGGRFKVKPERRADMVKLATSLYSPSRDEQGCLHYSCYQDAGDPDSFVFFEEWESQVFLDKHFQTSHFNDFMEQFPDMITGTPIIKIYNVSSVKEL